MIPVRDNTDVAGLGIGQFYSPPIGGHAERFDEGSLEGPQACVGAILNCGLPGRHPAMHMADRHRHPPRLRTNRPAALPLRVDFIARYTPFANCPVSEDGRRAGHDPEHLDTRGWEDVTRSPLGEVPLRLLAQSFPHPSAPSPELTT